MNISNNLLSDIKSIYCQQLVELYGTNESESLMAIIIQHFIGYTRNEMLINPNIRISESEILILKNALDDLKAMKPVQHITGLEEFLDFNISVNSDVLIPRPETEELVMLILKSENANGLKLLDVGTGSGCIAIAMYHMLSNPEIYAVDKSDDALEIAKFNANNNNAIINFKNLDVTEKQLVSNLSNFDIIVSNPPYVTNSEKILMSSNVIDYEPHIALFVPDDDPLKYYKAIIDLSCEKLKPRGRLYLEINEAMGHKLKDLLTKSGYINVLIHKDINSKDRFVTAIKME